MNASFGESLSLSGTYATALGWRVQRAIGRRGWRAITGLLGGLAVVSVLGAGGLAEAAPQTVAVAGSGGVAKKAQPDSGSAVLYPDEVEKATKKDNVVVPPPKSLAPCEKYLSAKSYDAEAYAACKAGLLDGGAAKPEKAQPKQGGGGVSLAAMQVSCPVGGQVVTSNVEDFSENADSMTRHVATGVVQLTGPSVLKVQTTALTTTIGCSVADTVAWLIACPDPGCTTGTVVAVRDDDPGTLASTATYPNAPAGFYRWVVHAYNSARCGTALVTVSANQAIIAQAVDANFGGLQQPGTIATNDVLIVGKAPVGASISATIGVLGPQHADYHDSMAFAFGRSTFAACETGNCGQFRYNDDTWYGGNLASRVLLSRIDFTGPWETASSIVVVGTYDNTIDGKRVTMAARIMHLRTHASVGGEWPCYEQLDGDGDGLPYEVEQEVDSCDSMVDSPQDGTDEGIGVIGWGCNLFRARINAVANTNAGAQVCPEQTGAPFNAACWHASDSDHDGLSDDQEVWAAAGACNGVAVPPYFDQVQCDKIPLSPPPFCPAGKSCLAEAVSANDLFPSRNEAVVTTDPDSCTAANCATWHNGNNTLHYFNNAQVGTLRKFWGEENKRCWNNTEPPCDDPVNDIPWNARLRIRELPLAPMQDDTYGDEINTAGVAQAMYNIRFPQTWKSLRLGHYALLVHGGGGSTSNTRWTIAANMSGDSDGERGPVNMAHEAGHMRTLDHPHHLNTAATCSPACPTASSRDGSCTLAQSCTETDTVNPIVASLMSYHYLKGMRSKIQATPEADSVFVNSCTLTAMRFSKGLNPLVDEQHLHETTSLDWRNLKLVRDLWCFAGQPNQQYCTPYSPFSPTGGDNQGPFCSPFGCVIDWNQNGAISVDELAADVSRGRYDNQPSPTCDMDRLEDVNEWEQLVTRGREGLEPAPTYHDVAIYVDSFNGGAIGNIVPWGDLLTVSQAGGVAGNALTYPVNVCTPVDAGCVLDFCTPVASAQCVLGQCAAGGTSCYCTADSECHSGKCIIPTGANDGACDTSQGALSCFAGCVDTECAVGPNNTCVLSKPWTKPPSSSPKSVEHRHVKSFGGPATADNITITSAPQGPLQTIGTDHQQYSMRVDFRYDPFVAGQATRTIFAAPFLTVTLVGGFGGDSLRIESGGSTVIWPTPAGGARLEPRRWYRLRVSYAQNGYLALKVVAWNKLTGWYDEAMALSASSCVRKPVVNGLQSGSTAWFGYNGTEQNSQFSGFMDNAHLRNFAITDPKHPDFMGDACAVLP